MRKKLGRMLRRLGLRPGPLDYTSSGPGVGEDRAPGPVDVIVPVHGAHEETRQCLRSLSCHTDFERHRVLIVVDGDPEFSDDEARRAFSAGERVEVLRNGECRGFVASVNRGMAHSESDVVLLNSDTLASADWLEKMQAAAYSDPAVATVTPFSNNATICSLPRPLEANELPAGFDVERFAALVEEVSERRYPRLPTGVGMCLYVKRRVLERLGLFDEASFGTGYGEETDFCFRALKAGFVHVLDDATFVFHHGEASFAGRRAERVRAAERKLARLHPEYVPTIADFLDRDPLRQCRERVVARLGTRPRSRGPARVLHLVHGWPPYNHAGTELYARWLAERQSREREVAVYARIADPKRHLGEATEPDDGAMRVRLVVNNFTQRNPLSRNAFHNRRLEDDFTRFLADARPELIHVHHLAGHAFSLLQRAAAHGVPVVYQVQDWWAMCARANLFTPERGLCPGPSPARCSACLPLTRLPPESLLNPLLYRYRRQLAERSLGLADAYVMGSRFIERFYRDQGLLRPEDRVYVLPYGVETPEAKPTRRDVPELPLRFGYIGSIQPHKGVHVAAEAFRGMDPARATLDVWGDPKIDPAYTQELRRTAPPELLRLRGRFAEEEKGEIFAGLDVLLIPSLGLESFGLVAREALAYGVPVIASRRSALEELFAQENCRGGKLVEAGDAEQLRRQIEELAADPEVVARWRRQAPPVTSCDEHAAAIEEVYADVMMRLRP